MKDTLALLSLYNKKVNEKVIGILKALSEDQLKKDTNTYYHSLLAAFVHMTTADVNWMGRLKPIFPYEVLAKSQLLQVPLGDLRAKIDADYREIFTIRSAADALFDGLIQELREEDLETIITYKNKKGDELSKKFGHVLLHLFNHQTHHRGEISAVLDIQNISNDYSGMLNYL